MILCFIILFVLNAASAHATQYVAFVSWCHNVYATSRHAKFAMGGGCIRTSCAASGGHRGTGPFRTSSCVQSAARAPERGLTVQETGIKQYEYKIRTLCILSSTK